MIVYLILIVIFGLVAISAIVLLIVGLVKRKRTVLITSIVLLAVGITGCIISAFSYTKKVIDYVRSEEFQNDTKKGAELIGRTAGSATSGISSGVANTLDDTAIKNLAGKSATILSTVTKTVASTLDSTIGNKNIYMDTTLQGSGIELGRAEEQYNSGANDLGIFIDYTKDFKGTLRMVNYDQNGLKIDAAETTINAKAAKGHVEVFSFKHSRLGLTTYYILSKTH